MNQDYNKLELYVGNKTAKRTKRINKHKILSIMITAVLFFPLDIQGQVFDQGNIEVKPGEKQSISESEARSLNFSGHYYNYRYKYRPVNFQDKMTNTQIDGINYQTVLNLTGEEKKNAKLDVYSQKVTVERPNLITSEDQVKYQNQQIARNELPGYHKAFAVLHGNSNLNFEELGFRDIQETWSRDGGFYLGQGSLGTDGTITGSGETGFILSGDKNVVTFLPGNVVNYNNGIYTDTMNPYFAKIEAYVGGSFVDIDGNDSSFSINQNDDSRMKIEKVNVYNTAGNVDEYLLRTNKNSNISIDAKYVSLYGSQSDEGGLIGATGVGNINLKAGLRSDDHSGDNDAGVMTLVGNINAALGNTNSPDDKLNITLSSEKLNLNGNILAGSKGTSDSNFKKKTKIAIMANRKATVNGNIIASDNNDNETIIDLKSNGSTNIDSRKIYASGHKSQVVIDVADDSIGNSTEIGADNGGSLVLNGGKWTFSKWSGSSGLLNIGKGTEVITKDTIANSDTTINGTLEANTLQTDSLTIGDSTTLRLLGTTDITSVNNTGTKKTIDLVNENMNGYLKLGRGDTIRTQLSASNQGTTELRTITTDNNTLKISEPIASIDLDGNLQIKGSITSNGVTLDNMGPHYFSVNSNNQSNSSNYKNDGAKGLDAIAIGNSASAIGDNSIALGAGSIADEANVISVGRTKGENRNAITRRITNVSNGIYDNDAVNVSQLSDVKQNITNGNLLNNIMASFYSGGSITNNVYKPGSAIYTQSINNLRFAFGDGLKAGSYLDSNKNNVLYISLDKDYIQNSSDFKGLKGETGDKGPTGDKGATGDKGPQGDQGLKGETGDKGPAGDKGETGDKGPQGDQGLKGETGDKGPAGDKGAQGPFSDENATIKKLTINDHLLVEGNAVLNKNLTVNGYTTLGPTTINKYLDVQGDVRIYQNLFVGGDASVRHNLDVGNTITTNTIVANNAVIGGRSILEEFSRQQEDINRVGAGAAALSALQYLPYEAGSKLVGGAGYGHYRGSNAGAIGLRYYPNRDMALSLASTIGNGDAMLNAGLSFRIGRGSELKNNVNTIVALEESNKLLSDRLDEMEKELKQSNDVNKELMKRLEYLEAKMK